MLNLYWATLCHLYGFQLPAALFALVRIFFRAIFFFSLRNTERVGGAVLKSVPHTLSLSLTLPLFHSVIAISAVRRLFIPGHADFKRQKPLPGV